MANTPLKGGWVQHTHTCTHMYSKPDPVLDYIKCAWSALRHGVAVLYCTLLHFTALHCTILGWPQNLRVLAFYLSRTELKFDLLSAVDELNKQIRLEFDFVRCDKSKYNTKSTCASAGVTYIPVLHSGWEVQYKTDGGCSTECSGCAVQRGRGVRKASRMGAG